MEANLYQLVVWGPVLVVLAMAAVLFFSGEIQRVLAIALPALLAGAELMMLLAIYEHPHWAILSNVLFLQGGALGIISGIFLLITFGIWLYKKRAMTPQRVHTRTRNILRIPA